MPLNDRWPSSAVACFIPDAVVSMLTGEAPRTEPTDGGSSGIFDIVARDWDRGLVERLGLPEALFPPVGEPGDPAGVLRGEVARQVGLPDGLPVGLAIGDNQASFLGSVGQPEDDLLLNVGTGAQISARMDAFGRVPGLDTRYYPGGRYLLVGAGLFGGRTLAYLRDLFRRVGASFYGGDEEAVSYDAMCALAAQVPPGSDGLRCVPAFTGTREDPDLRASYSGLTPENLTPGHLTRAMLEGMAESFYSFYERMEPLIGGRGRLVGSGNGIALNPLFARILAHRFGLALHLPASQEEASIGAALLAAVSAGEVESLDTAAALLRYDRVVPPKL
jgi:sedoheptulokinase